MSADQPTWRVEVVEETGSTNADLLASAAAGAPDRTVLCARHQTSGRGRLDRRWDAPPGVNLLVSTLFRTGIEHPHRLTQQVAVAAAVASERSAGWPVRTVGIKWPNDLLVGGRKLAGILAQAGGTAGRVQYVVVGLGLNVQWAPDDAARLGEGIDPLDVLAGLLVALDERGDAHGDEYRARLVTLDQSVVVTTPVGKIVGRAVDVLADGRLVVRPSDGGPDISLDTGDVIHVRPMAD